MEVEADEVPTVLVLACLTPEVTTELLAEVSPVEVVVVPVEPGYVVPAHPPPVKSRGGTVGLPSASTLRVIEYVVLLALPLLLVASRVTL